MINVAVLGYGTVGSGVVEVLESNKELIAKRVGDEVNVKYILDLRDFPGDPYESKVVHDVNLIMEDPEVSIVCETMGGAGAAYKFSKEALSRSKSVCTSNKELVSLHGPELLNIAKDNNCSYLFEASVGGGIPIIRPIVEALTAERLDAVMGILNGTTNFILTKMDKEGADFDTTLKEAQRLGYAEANPEADIEGHDARRKIAILSSLMTGKHVKDEKVYTEGITRITAADFKFAHSFNATIKLLGMAKRAGKNEAEAMVSPFVIGNEHPLATVNDVFNAVFVTGNMLGDAMFYGKGAGKLPTASAVCSDVIECAKNLGKNLSCDWSDEEVKLLDVSDVERSFMVRFDAAAVNEIKNAFGDNISDVTLDNEMAVLTAPMKESDFNAKCEALKDAVHNRIRVL
ncbi:MAG: homoserine dehydrogenase [Lachnospiraceae bacterium]|nr:homoserine dehydrogenase [Lachnospiraceae bacterium]